MLSVRNSSAQSFVLSGASRQERFAEPDFELLLRPGGVAILSTLAAMPSENQGRMSWLRAKAGELDEFFAVLCDGDVMRLEPVGRAAVALHFDESVLAENLLLERVHKFILVDCARPLQRSGSLGQRLQEWVAGGAAWRLED
jgi:hypothetical protein